MNGSQNSESSQEVKNGNSSETSTDTLQSFDDFDLHVDVKDSLKKMGISTPTPIQSKVIAPNADDEAIYSFCRLLLPAGSDTTLNSLG